MLSISSQRNLKSLISMPEKLIAVRFNLFNLLIAPAIR